jgi:hypothetical protein
VCVCVCLFAVVVEIGLRFVQAKIATAVERLSPGVKPTALPVPKLARTEKTTGDVWEKALLYPNPARKSNELVEHLAVASVMIEERRPLSPQHDDLWDLYQSLCNPSLWVRCDSTACGKWRQFPSTATTRHLYRQWRQSSFECIMNEGRPCKDPCHGRCNSMPCQCEQVWQNERGFLSR